MKKIVLTAVLTALSIAGRIAFAMLPGFKPVTAFVIVAGMYLGAKSGAVCGALSALITNCFFGQGLHTPFQMTIWALIGVLSAVFSGGLKKSKIWLTIFGALSGILFSLFMDVFSVLWLYRGFNLGAYLIMLQSSLPFMIVYMVSNVFFLWTMCIPLGKKIDGVVAAGNAVTGA